MKEPTFYADGYPTDETLHAIETWPVEDSDGLLVFVIEAWHSQFGSIQETLYSISFKTGGWSGNESIISAMQGNAAFWAMRWDSSHSGGIHVFRKGN